MATRQPLSRERVLRAAVELADEHGIAALTMRALAQRLTVKPMAVYHYFDGKEQILDGVVDAVFVEIPLTRPSRRWREELAGRARALRLALRRHPWAIGLLESRARPGTATLQQHDAVLGMLFDAGFTVALAAHAYALVDSYVYGFALQEATLPIGPEPHVAAAEVVAGVETIYPHLARFASELVTPSYRFGDEFDFGLSVVLDGIEAALTAPVRP
jgi:AcrR family transcriptional regulator